MVKLKFKLTKKGKRLIQQITRITTVVAVAVVAIFGSYKLISFGADLIFGRNRASVSSIILGDGQKVATASHAVAKRIAATMIAQEDAKQKASQGTEATRQKEIEMTSLDELEEQIDAYLKSEKVKTNQLTYKIIDIPSGKEIGKNADINMLAGSCYKLPLSLLWYDKLDRGDASLDDKLYWGDNISETEGRMQFKWKEGDYISLENVLAYTLKYSDNVGGHILYESYGGWDKFKKDAAKYSDKEQAEEFFSKENYLNAEYMADVMKHIYNNQEKYETLIHYLTIAAPDDFLNSKLRVDMVQKVGFYNEHINSCGLCLDGRPYVLCVFTTLNDRAVPIMGEINEMVYNYINNELPPIAWKVG